MEQTSQQPNPQLKSNFDPQKEVELSIEELAEAILLELEKLDNQKNK